ncbi:MAG TPA: T9SS type A sorting domain-containing protein, partial [Ignavibacteria bacterium]|nr:T9SS type A sorting domain-containing protein [Ignavibacteria bacterium]
VNHMIDSGKLSNNITYQWKVRASNTAGTSQWSAQWNFTPRITTVPNNNATVPDKYNLSQNYPNPFNPSTQIKFSVPQTKNVRISIYDALGKEVSVLLNEVKNPGEYVVTFNGNNLSSGIYFYKLTSGDFTDIKKMILVK